MMTIVLSSMHNTLEAYRESRQRMSSVGNIELPSEQHLPNAVGLVCNRCMKGYSTEVQNAAHQVIEFVESIHARDANGESDKAISPMVRKE